MFELLTPAHWITILGVLLLALIVVWGLTFKTGLNNKKAINEACDKLEKIIKALKAFDDATEAQIRELKNEMKSLIKDQFSGLQSNITISEASTTVDPDTEEPTIQVETSLSPSQDAASDATVVDQKFADDADRDTMVDDGTEMRPKPALSDRPIAHDADATAMFEYPTESPEDSFSGLPYFKIIEGGEKGDLFYLNYSKSTLGRHKDNDIQIEDDFASSFHCEITFKNNQFILADNNSKNGTLCNDEEIAETTLNLGDRVKIGNFEMIFSCKGFELKDTDPDGAIAEFEKCLTRESNFIGALENLAFLLERNIARKKEAQPLWERISALRRKK